MPSHHRGRPDRPRAPSAPPRLGPGYRVWKVTATSPFDGWCCVHRPVACWVHWTGARDEWCYGPGDACDVCRAGTGSKWTSWVLAVRSCSRGIWAVQVTRAAAVNDETGLWGDGNADLYSRALQVCRIRSGPQGALRMQIGGLPLKPRHVPLRQDLTEWVQRLYGVAAPDNDQGGADQLGTAPPM